MKIKSLIVSAMIAMLCMSVSIAETNSFAVWKTVKIGSHKNSMELWKTVVTNKCNIIGVPETSFSVVTNEQEVSLVLITAEQLGFPVGTSYERLLERADQLGLKPCTMEIGLQALLQGEVPAGEQYLVAMNPVMIHPDPETFRLGIFSLAKEKTLKGVQEYRIRVTSRTDKWLFAQKR